MAEDEAVAEEVKEAEQAVPQDDLEMLMGVTKYLSSIAEKGESSVIRQQETLKSQMQRYRDNRTSRLQSLEMTHRQILDMVSTHLMIDPNEAVENTADYDENLELFESFLSAGGRQGIIFFYCPGEPPELETGRYNPSYGKEGGTFNRLFITDGNNKLIRGKVVICYTTASKAVDMKNINDEVFYNSFDLDELNGNIVAGLYNFLSTLIRPSLIVTKEWGDMVKTTLGLKMKKYFVDEFEAFVGWIHATKIDLEGIVTFNVNMDVYHDIVTNPKSYQKIDQEEMLRVELEIRMWTKQMERVLTQFKQLRREDEFVGPYVEIEYWRRQLARFTSIVEFIKSPHCSRAIQYLVSARSKVIKKVWVPKDNAVTNARNECSDNVKFLYALEKFYEPLYRCDPTEIPAYIPSLLYAIRMVFTTSRYFNNTASVTAILVKVSNQMINVCRKYLNCDNTITIWSQPKDVVLKKIKICLDLYMKYYQCYKGTLKAMEEAQEPAFNCSEIYVFGKFETFKKRLEDIVDVLNTVIKYSILHSSTIEDIDTYAEKFDDYFKTISSKTYDALNHRQPFFDKDYEIFKHNVANLEWDLEEFVANSLDKLSDIDNVLRLLNRFEKLQLECLRLDERYLEAIEMLQDEIEFLRDKYNEDRQNPLVPWNLPPVSGRIMWIRQFYARMATPMDVFRTKTRVMRHRKSQKCIQLFNAMSCVFIHFEKVYHTGWYDFVAQVRTSLSAPVLAKDIRTRMYIVNFDPYIVEVIRETEYMYKLGLKVPAVAEILVFSKSRLLNSFEMIKCLVERNNTVRRSIPNIFLPMMRNFMLELENVFMPGFSTITWTSMKIPQFCDEITHLLNNVQMFIKEVTDMKEARIDEVLESIAQTSLVHLPSEPIMPAEIVELNIEHRKAVVSEIEQKSWNVERTVIDLINKFLDTMTAPELQEGKYDWLDPELAVKPLGSTSKLLGSEGAAFKEVDRNIKLDLPTIHSDCNELFSYFNENFVDVLVRCTKLSLEQLKQRATYAGSLDKKVPLMKTWMELHIPINTINPTLDQIQGHFAQVLNNIVETTKDIVQWGQRPVYGEDKTQHEFTNYYKQVSEQKEIVRIFMGLQGAMYLLQPDVQKLLKQYLSYSYLWAEDREEQITAFVDTNPLTVEVGEKFSEYEAWSEEIKELPEIHDIGALRILMEDFKMALLVESEAWKHQLGKTICQTKKQQLNDMVSFIRTQEKILSRPINDLDDCRIAMACLATVREHFIEMDIQLSLMEEAYALLAKFKIDVPKEDIERVDSLRFNFTNMINHSKEVTEDLCKKQGPFQQELIAGVNKFKGEVEQYDIDFEENGPMIEGLSAREASDRVQLFQARFDDLWAKYEIYTSGEQLYGMEVTDYPALHQRKRDLQLLQKLYGLYLQVNHTIDGWYDVPWTDIDIETISDTLTDFQNKCRRLPKALKDWPAFLDLKKKIDDFNETCPLLELMANKAMKDRHWKRLSDLTGYSFDVESPSFTLRNVMEAPLLQYKDDVEDICVSAIKEKDIEAKLKGVISDWSSVELSFAAFKNRGELLLKGGETMDIMSAMDDSLMILNSLLGNRYNAPYKKDIQLWVNRLVTSSDVLEKWLTVQNLWVYLEAVFVGGDIARQLPAEAKRFALIDKTWVRIMFRARDMPNVIECCTSDETMTQLLPHLMEQLESCQKSLSGYLESKRLLFPRFFFISDPVLLEILGQASDPHSIQPHLLSLFDNVAEVEFDAAVYEDVVAMKSDLGERVPFEKHVRCLGGVEVWLNTLLRTVLDTVKSVIASIAQALNDPDYDFVKNFVTYCGQAGLVGVQILWTKEAEYALKRSRIDSRIMPATNQRFLDLLNAFIDLTSQDLTKLQRIRYETMITIHVHQRDIFDDIVRMKVRSETDFEWQKQSRFYYSEDTDDLIVRITDVIFIYQDEYLGVTERLCITPLTDRCYITLAQAIWMNMGGAPAGPAGTGKTETVKDMGRALGKYVVVFNCSDQMDFRGLGRIFKGLAQSGTWGCFDEFNRIDLPVLSVAAQQIYIVLTARKERKPSFIFSDGDTVTMNIEFGIFLTMNPGYAGRQELPENLKIQFRSVAMMVPDRQIIIRVKLASCGFRDNIILSAKFFTLYQLCEEQLSKQVHYDFGLRNILSVLRTLGSQKREHPDDTEETIVMRVLRDMNLSKLVDEDEPLFLSLIEDMFPGIKLSVHSWKDLQKAIGDQCQEMELINYPDWNLKVIQLYETSLVRHGLMVLGPTGAGKTKNMHILMRAMTQNGLPHKEMRMNPKAITAPQMFGRLDAATNDWTDGIFSTLWRRTLKVKKTDFVWLVLDGPVDAVWIENLNSVLDDNKTLTLANGDRIVMAPNCKLVFEPDNVDNASPATVSRMGMVFMSASVLPWRPLLDGYLRSRPQQADLIRNLFGKVYDELFNLVKVKLKPKMSLLEALYIRQSCDVMEGLLQEGEETRTFSDKHVERLFVFSLMWSLGAVLELDDRAKWEEVAIKLPGRIDWPKSKEITASIFEFLVDDNGKWLHWSERVDEFVYPPDQVLEFTSILVPNVDNVRTGFLINNIAKQGKAVLLIGEQGTAKTVMIKGYLNTFDPDYKLSKSFNMSYATTPNMVQRIIESYVEKRVGTTYGPPAGKTLSIFIDDISMPVVNDWGDQVTNEIVRQVMESGGFYSLDKPGDFSSIVDVHFLAAMIHPGGGRNDIPNRLKRQYNIFNCTIPSDSSMDQIFGSIGEGYFCSTRFNDVIVDFFPNLIPLTRRLWQRTKGKMLPTPAKFHYVFNLRDLSRIWQGILTIHGPECETITKILKLWAHECSRVISDRFTSYQDRDWFANAIKTQVREDLGDDFYSQYFDETETYFVDFLREPPEATGDEPDDFDFSAPKIYEEMPSWEFLIGKLFSYMDGYNETVRSGQLDLVFFHDAIVHLVIISRIVRTPRGSGLLVGVGGSGKQSLTKLASFIADYTIFQIQVTRSYNLNNFMDDMKKLYHLAGVKGTGVSFIFTDNDIKDEDFLELLNNILSSGEIANLFARDELDEITNELIPVMKKQFPRRPPTNDALYDYFITRSRSNLHVVLCFSPVGEKFRSRAMKFPGLISGTTMDWFFRWPKDALVAVSNHFLAEYQVECTPDVKAALINVVAEMQDGVADTCIEYYDRFRRQTYVTPKTYLSFLDNYKIVYKDKREYIQMLAVRMKTGLSKLIEAAESVDVLKKELEVKNKEVAEAAASAEKVLESVMKASEIANKIKEEATVVKDRAEELVAIISKDQKAAEEKLLAAKPALDAAEAALQTIKAADIATVRKLGKPPYLIMLIMDAVVIYFKKHLEITTIDSDKKFIVPSWNESLKVMADTGFLKKLQEYPKDTINAEMVDLLQPYFNNPLYTFENAKVACGNVAGLISWTIAMAAFYEVNRDVLPLKANLAIQQAKLDKAQAELHDAMEMLEKKEEEVRQCQVEYDNAMAFKQQVFDEAMKVQNKMDQATSLINGLSGERVRWTDQVAQFKAETERLVGDVLILTGFLGYSGPFNQEFRLVLRKMWMGDITKRKIPVSVNISIIDSLIDTATIGEWNLQGLPSDDLSIENGIIATKAARFPLLIDPQMQGKAWVKKLEAANDLIVTTLTHKYFRNFVEDAVSLGKPILIEDILEEIDPVLDNVLEKNLIKLGTTYKVKLGDKEVDWSKDFRIYMTTKLANPAYTPEIFARTSVIDFTVTMKGLEDQLLGRVIVTEKKELEIERNNLIKDVTTNKRKMVELEANLLHKLTTTKGSLVDDETVLEVLNNTRNTAEDVKEKLATARDTEVKINAAREEFRPIATRGSILYFLVVSMSMVNCMYQTSLVQFLERFDVSLARSDKSPITSKRITNVIDYLTFEIFKYQSRGLYEAHKYMFVLLLVLKVDLQRGTITYEEFQYLIKGGAALDLNECPPKPNKWITDTVWLNLVELSKLRHYQYILQQVQANDKGWKAWFDTETPEESPIPDGYQNLDAFRKLLLIRAWCTDRSIAQSRKYIAQSMGQRFAEPVNLDMEGMLKESRPLTPLVCFLSMGSDPTPFIEQLAKKVETKCKNISMGQGQEVHARKMMAQAMTDGFWALLQNCHLSLEYMQEVLIMFMELEKGNGTVHENFRFWLTTEVHCKFPIGLLQICIKFTIEPPSGVRAGLMRTYTSMSQDMLDYTDAWQYLPLIYAISFLHTIVQERRKFGPLGWNIPYEFNSADWLASCMFVQNHLEDIDPKKGISWTTLRYMLGEVQYGGRVTDDFDKRLLNCFTTVWFSDATFADDFEFFKGYKVLKYKVIQDYVNAFEQMSPVDPPQVYGLHPNADITYQNATASDMYNTMLSIQPKEAGGGSGESRESVVTRMAKDMISKLPPDYDFYEVKDRLVAMGILNPLNIFLRQEIDRMQKVITAVRLTLRDLLLAIEGTIIMSDALRDALDNIYDAKVPLLWRRDSWVSSTIGFWYTELLERNLQFTTWCYGGRPMYFWMTGFFNPQGFLTAMKQEVSRAHKGWALDQVTLQNDVLKQYKEEIKAAPQEGVYVYGLFLDGAGWDKKNSVLIESTLKVLFTQLPVVFITAINSTDPKDPKLYTCPVYKKPRRTGLNYITVLWLQTVPSPNHWILRGVALLCDTK